MVVLESAASRPTYQAYARHWPRVLCRFTAEGLGFAWPEILAAGLNNDTYAVVQRLGLIMGAIFITGAQLG